MALRLLSIFAYNTAFYSKSNGVDLGPNHEGSMEHYLAQAFRGFSFLDSSEEIKNLLIPMKICLKIKFGEQVITPSEWSDGVFPFMLFQGLLIKRISEKLSLILNEPGIFESINSMQNGIPYYRPLKYEFIEPHLEDMTVKSKSLHITSKF